MSLSHPITDSELQEIYGKEYFTGKIYKNYIRERAFRTRLFERKLNLIRKHLPVTGKLLDVGSAAGFFLEVARKGGYEVCGVELSKFAAAYATESLGLKIHEGQLEDAKFPSRYFDIVTMWDVLEHLRRPLETLQEASRLLRRCGVIVIETLNVDCVGAKILGSRWPLYQPPYHLFYFSLRTLHILLSKAGFRVFRVIPVQTYSPIHSHRALRYFDNPFIPKRIVGQLLGDVVIVLARNQT